MTNLQCCPEHPTVYIAEQQTDGARYPQCSLIYVCKGTESLHEYETFAIHRKQGAYRTRLAERRYKKSLFCVPTVLETG